MTKIQSYVKYKTQTTVKSTPNGWYNTIVTIYKFWQNLRIIEQLAQKIFEIYGSAGGAQITFS